jgi:hypothetical protein
MTAMWLLAMDDATRQWVHRVAKLSASDWIAPFAFNLFIVIFIVAAVAMLAGACLPRRLPGAAPSVLARLAHSRGRIIVIGSAVLLFLCAISQQLEIDHRRGHLADENRIYEKKVRSARTKEEREAILKSEYLYIPEGNTLKYMSLGNTSLAADYLWLTSTQYVSRSFRRGERFKLLMKFYESILELDPHWTEIQINAGRTLSALHPERYDVETFYIKSIQKNPDAWMLYFEAGRLFIFPPSNPKLKKDFASRAVFWFRRTVDKLKHLPDTPSVRANIRYVESLLSQMALDSGQIDVSDKMTFTIASDPENPPTLRVATAQEWLMARSLLIESKLQEQITKIKELKGAYPASLAPAFDALKGDARVQPVDPFGYPVQYNPQTGLVKSLGVLARKTLQAHAIVTALKNTFKAEHKRPPNNLSELQAFVQKHYGPPNDKAGAAVTDWIGEELNVLTSPLGAPWDYDPKSGEVELPAEIHPQLLYLKVKEHFPDIYPD